MSSDAFSLGVEEYLIFDDSRFPCVKEDFCTCSTSHPDVNLKRKYPMSCLPFPLKEKLPIISYLQNRFLPETDLETAAWASEIVTHRVALSSMTGSFFKLSVEVYQKIVFIRIRTLELPGVHDQTIEQKNMKAATVALLTDSEGPPRWRNYILRRMKIGNHKVYFNAMVDGKRKGGSYIRIKSRRGCRLTYKSVMKLWLENYLSGVESSLIGYHNQTGKITKVEYFSSNSSLSNVHKIKKEKFDEELSKIDEVLTQIMLYVQENPEIKKFEVVKVSDKAGLKFTKDDEYDFLTPEFKAQFPEPS